MTDDPYEAALAGLTPRQRRSVLNAVASGHLEGFDASPEDIQRLATIAKEPSQADVIIAELVARYAQSSSQLHQ